MRKFDDDGQPEPEAVEFGEFLIKVRALVCGCANNVHCTHVRMRNASHSAKEPGQSSAAATSTISYVCGSSGACAFTSAAISFCLLHACSAAWLACGMARMPNNPSLLVMYASYMIESRKDGQAARTQLQLAQKANPNMLDTHTIYVAEQLAKQLKRGE
jgi:hypothetical protein